MTEFEIDKDAPILVEFTEGPGLKQVAISDVMEKLPEMSAEAVQSAMDTIHNMANKVAATVRSLAARPAEVEVTFGLKFDLKAGVLIASTGVGASVQIKLKWKQG